MGNEKPEGTLLCVFVEGCWLGVDDFALQLSDRAAGGTRISAHTVYVGKDAKQSDILDAASQARNGILDVWTSCEVPGQTAEDASVRRGREKYRAALTDRS